MKVATLREFSCPQCGSDLRLLLGKELDGAMTEGLIGCPACTAEFHIKNGIPRFVPSQEYAESFGFQWNRFRQTQLDSHTGLPLSRDRLFAVTKWPTTMNGERILEAG